VFELNPYRTLELRFRDLTSEQIAPLETIWYRQRQVRPVLVLTEPALVATGSQTPMTTPEEARRCVLYGYMGDSLQVDGVGWNHSDVRVTITESAG
jgi:hypothetical protein